MQTITQQIEENKRKSKLVIFGFVILIGLIAFLLLWVISRLTGKYNIKTIIIWTGIILLIAGCYTFWVYFHVNNILLHNSSALKLSKAKFPKLYDIVEELIMVADIPMPSLYMIKDPSINAFATGRDPKHASIAVNSGTLSKLNREELQGVLGHELSHIKNYDTRTDSIAVALTGFIAASGIGLCAVGFAMMRSNFWFSDGDHHDNNNWYSLIAILGFGIVLWIGGWLIRLFGVPLARIMQYFLSRQRESLADVSSVNLTKNPKGLIKAFRVMEKDSTAATNDNAVASALFINTPTLKGKREPLISRLFDTHPPLGERISRLKKLLNNN